MDTTHLKRRHQTWYARLAVPPSLRAAIGKSEIVRSLHTRDLREANRLKHRVIADMHRWMADQVTEAGVSQEDPAFMLEVAKNVRARVIAAELTPDAAEEEFDNALDSHLDRVARKYGIDDRGHARLSDEHVALVQLATRIASGEEVTLLAAAIDKYLAETAPRVRKATLGDKKRQLAELCAWMKKGCEVRAVTKKQAGRYLSEVLLTKGHTPKTVKDTLSNLSAFFSWLEDRGEVEVNPWRNISRTIRASTRGAAPSRRPWTDAELTALFGSIDDSDPLRPMVAIAAYSGMRLEEIANLRVADVSNDAFRITEGKTASAVRFVPIHPVLRQLVARLVDTAKDEFLIPGLLRGGRDAKRGHYVGKRFGRAIRKLGFADSALTFHTLRNSFMQRCEEASIPESTVKLIVGHKRSSLTYGLYSPGLQLSTLAKELNKITFGKTLDLHVRRAARTINVTKRSSRRYTTLKTRATDAPRSK